MVYGPPTWRPAAFAGAAVLAAALSAFSLVLLAPAAVSLAIAIRDWATRPALTLTPDGFRYAIGLGHATASWDEVETVRIRQERHFLAFGRNLEIDLHDETLIVLSGFQLGSRVDEATAAVETAWHQFSAWRGDPADSAGDGGGSQQGRRDEHGGDQHDTG